MKILIRNKGVIIFYLVILVSSFIYIKFYPNTSINEDDIKYVYEYGTNK